MRVLNQRGNSVIGGNRSQRDLQGSEETDEEVHIETYFAGDLGNLLLGVWILWIFLGFPGLPVVGEAESSSVVEAAGRKTSGHPAFPWTCPIGHRMGFHLPQYVSTFV